MYRLPESPQGRLIPGDVLGIIVDPARTDELDVLLVQSIPQAVREEVKGGEGVCVELPPVF